MSRKLAFIGGGNMGYALASRIASDADDVTLVVADPVQEQRERFAALEIQTTSNNKEAVSVADAVVLAVKPQVLRDVLNEIRPCVTDQLFVSIVAGVPMDRLALALGEDSAIVRCMPNTPALIGEGITGMIANAHATTEHKNLAEGILRHAGSVVWFREDRELDAVTAISGSGPAYFFYLMEHMIAAALELGLNETDARQLVLKTATGATQMAEHSEHDPAELRAQVTSPAGTTESALNVMSAASMDQTVRKAVSGAFNRSIELANEFGQQT